MSSQLKLEKWRIFLLKGFANDIRNRLHRHPNALTLNRQTDICTVPWYPALKLWDGQDHWIASGQYVCRFKTSGRKMLWTRMSAGKDVLSLTGKTCQSPSIVPGHVTSSKTVILIEISLAKRKSVSKPHQNSFITFVNVPETVFTITFLRSHDYCLESVKTILFVINIYYLFSLFVVLCPEGISSFN